ncbi:PP2C family serine/threonine-protein phosphatase [Bacillus alkalicellulosilyticus]|uniref:PP2C family serine/threonine-protein phosphatase n=1 Tax=Alkalihalobacterium alkalicellulosilyticum TaxID=1912214 RepID=UPI0009963991|nr:PP2C family serine/threonine-protein phosphatase [Bacillus alkalicellulosilyticus]
MVEFTKFDSVKVAIYQKAKQGNDLCGDSYVIIETDRYFLCAIADGLGSGEGAHCASVEAITIIKENHDAPVEVLMSKCNEAQLSRRGIVMTIVKIDYEQQRIHYSNVGNIGFVFYLPSGKVVRPIPQRGFLSGRKVMIKEESFPYESGSTFILYSDGLHSSNIKPLNLTTLHSPDDATEFIRKNIKNKEDDLTVLIAQIR